MKILFISLFLSSFLVSFGQDSTKVKDQFPDFSSKGLRIIEMSNTYAEMEVLKRISESGFIGDLYNVESVSFATHGLLADHFGLSLGVATQHSSSGSSSSRRRISLYTIEPGLFVPITVGQSAIILHSNLSFTTYLSKRASTDSEDWNSLEGWSAGIAYPLYLPQHDLTLTVDASYSNTSELNGSISEPEFRGLTFSLSPQLIYSRELKNLHGNTSDFSKGSWSLDGASTLMWNRDVKPERDREDVTFGDQVAKLTYTRNHIVLKGSYYLMNALAIQCDLGYISQFFNSEVSDENYQDDYTYSIDESVLRYSIGLRVHPWGPKSGFYLGATAGQKAAKVEVNEDSYGFIYEDSDLNTEGLLYRFELGQYAHILPNIALDPHIAYGRYSADSGSEYNDKRGFRLGLGLVAFLKSKN